MPASVHEQQPQWPLRPDARPPAPDYAAEFLALRRNPGRGKVTGLSVAISDWLDVNVMLIRALFVITSFSSGFGLLVYLTGYALTRNEQTGRAPLDRLGTGWHDLAPRVVIGWGLGLSAAMSLTMATMIGFQPISLIVLGLVGWLGYRSRRRPPLPPRQRYPLPNQTVPPPIAARSVAAGQQRRSTLPLSITVIALAVLAGGLVWDVYTADLVLSLAVALLVVGTGAVLIAFQGRSVLLVLTGIGLVVALGAAYYAPVMPAQHSMYYTEQSDLHDMELTGGSYWINLNEVDLVADSVWHLDADQALVEIILPTTENVSVDVNYTDSFVLIDQDAVSGVGVSRYSQAPDEGQPTLTIVINANQSSVMVMP